MESLQLVKISKVQAIQRSGRAGRTREGKCIRLYSEAFYDNDMATSTVPEILRVNLTTTVLTLKSLGIKNLLNFEFMDKPNEQQLVFSLKQLFLIEAVDDHGRLTDLGREISKFPLDPIFTKAVFYSYALGRREKHNITLEDTLKLVSILSTENIWVNVSKNDSRGQASLEDTKREFADKEGDHFGLVNVYDAWKR
jgi:ATP-dependent RNA helicase DHX8/PRP22